MSKNRFKFTENLIDLDKRRILRIEKLFNSFKQENINTPNPDAPKDNDQETQKNKDLYEFYEGIMNTQLLNDDQLRRQALIRIDYHLESHI